MNIESYIKENIHRIVSSGGKVHLAPDIPEKKLNGAIASIAEGVDPNYVVAIMDTSFFGSGKEGCVFLGDSIYIKNPGKKKIAFATLAGIEKRDYAEEDKEGNCVIKTKIFIQFKDGTEEDITGVLSYVNKDAFVELLTEIINFAKDGEGVFESTNQACPLAMMDAEIKEAYIKLICNYAYQDDQIIDAREYAEIISLIVINSVSKESRLNLRNYMCDYSSVIDNKVLITYLEEHVAAGSFEAVKLSIMKDTVNLFWKREKTKEWKCNQYITRLQNDLNIGDEQIDYILDNIIENEKILTDRKSDIEIKKSMQELAAKAGAVGVPLAAIYLSGSVIGVSAAGMTSGLAALGMGGLLGFSSMLTGIGVAVLIGVGAYKGVKKVTGMGDLEKNKQREMMLQQIVKNSQKALNYLIEDVNEITRQLQEAIRKGEEADIKIKKISAMLTMMSQGAQKTTNQIEYTEREKVICHLPERINIDRIEEMTQGATRLSIRNLILSAYTEQKTKEDGTNMDHCLNTELGLELLEKVHAALEGIGYYNLMDASIASAKSVAKNLLKGVLG